MPLSRPYDSLISRAEAGVQVSNFPSIMSHGLSTYKIKQDVVNDRADNFILRHWIYEMLQCVLFDLKQSLVVMRKRKNVFFCEALFILL